MPTAKSPRLLTPALLLAAFACTTRGTDDPDAPDSTERVAEREIEVVEDGPWVIRRTSDPDGGLERKGLAEGDAVGIAAAESVDELAEPSSDARYHAGGRTAAPLRAGATDDNADLTAFLAYLEKQRQAPDLAGRWADLDVADARSIRVVDADGAPLPGIELRVIDEANDEVVWRGRTLGDGTVPFYPEVARADGAGAGPFLLEVRTRNDWFRQYWDGRGNECVVEVRADVPRTDQTVLDVAFLIDTTGSMSDEIERIKDTLLAVTERLRGLELEFDLRYAAVLYRDIGDEYLTKTHAFTGDIEAFDVALKQIVAGGGGDTPESLNQGLAVAVDGLDWREEGARLVFLVADAPPHMDYAGDVTYDRTLRSAVARGIRVHSVAASGLDEAGSVVFRQIAQFTRGEFVFIEYGGDTAASAAEHGVSGEVRSNNLDEILFERIRDEIAHWGRA